jgi:hypothetical protein
MKTEFPPFRKGESYWSMITWIYFPQVLTDFEELLSNIKNRYPTADVSSDTKSTIFPMMGNICIKFSSDADEADFVLFISSLSSVS